MKNYKSLSGFVPGMYKCGFLGRLGYVEIEIIEEREEKMIMWLENRKSHHLLSNKRPVVIYMSEAGIKLIMEFCLNSWFEVKEDSLKEEIINFMYYRLSRGKRI